MATRIVPIPCLVAVTTFVLTGNGVGLSGGPQARAQGAAQSREREPKGTPKTIGQVRGLVADLEAQAERQRTELRMTEAALGRARNLLAELEGDGGNSPQGHTQRPTALSPEERRSLPEQAAAEEKKWAWSDDRATAASSARALAGGYRVQFDPIPGKPGALTLTVTREGQAVHSWEGHPYSVFVLSHDLLYRADFQPSRTGCAVIAYDLAGGKQLWETRLWVVPVSAHSQYMNRINLEIDDRHLILYGNESFGRYLEILDLKTGKTVGQRLLGRPDSAR
jgi:hypothetical protein